MLNYQELDLYVVASEQFFVVCLYSILVTGFTVPQTQCQMVGLYQDPEGKTIFSNTDPSQSATKLASDKDTIELLRRQVQELKNEVSVIVM